MECLNCATVNRQGRRFCGSCGSVLPVGCPKCGFANEPEDAFCGGCGAAVDKAAALAAQPVLEAARPYSFEGDRRQLTVMFCDLVGSTVISEQLDPEEMTGLLTAYRIACAEVVEQYGGFIGNFMGDGLLIYFGYPQAHEDDPQRAIRAGLSIIAAVDELNQEFSAPDVLLNVRIGINTGLVVAADIGAGEQREKMAIVGDTPNIAARLQSLADPGTVVIGRRTHRLIEGLFVCEPLGAQTLKGITEPVEVYRVCETTEARSSFEAKLQRGLTPMAGRKEEVGLLVNRWDQAKEGDGQVVLISGEAGVGKSRVLQNFQSIVTGQNCPAISFVCSNYRQDTPFHPVIDFFERTLQTDANNAPGAMLDRLDAYLAALGLDVAEYGSLLAAMLNLPASGRYDVPVLTLEDQKNKTLKALVTVAEALSATSPLLIVVEDLQWADHSTREFLGLLVEHVRTSRILVVLAFRTDFEPDWTRQPHLTVMRLRHLSRPESIELVEGVTGGRPLPDEVLEHILSKTDGVPLFIEELTKLVLEMDLLELKDGRYILTGPLGATEIPDSLQDSLMARLDHLGSAKEAAQLASVLGRTFGHALLLAVTQKSEEALDHALTRLVDSELLYRRGLAPEIVYEFKHALVKDAAYQGLLHSKRRQLHLEIAEILEVRFPQMTERSPELLSYHYKEAGDVEKAIPYSFKAGDAAAERYASTEASAHYQSALEMAKSVPSTNASARHQIRAILKLANVAATRDQFERNLGNLGTARALAENIDHQIRLCQIQYWTGRTYYVLGRFGLAADLARQALELADRLGDDDRMKTGPVNLLARVHCLLGEPVAAINYATQSVRQMHDTGDHVEEAAVSGVLAFALAQHGQYEQAMDAANHGVTLAQEVDHLPTVAACLMFRGVVNGWFGRLTEATPDFEQGLYVCEKSGDVFRKYLTLGWRGEACLVAGELVSARNNLEQCLELGTTLGTSFHRGAFEAFLAKALLSQGESDKAMRLSEAAIITATESGETWPRSIALRVATEVQIGCATPDIAAAEASINSAIAIQTERQCKCDLAWSHLVLGHVLAAKGDHDQAAKAYAVTRSMFEDLRIERGIELTKTALVSLKGIGAEAG
ncbi:ATP-binding protein [Roseobacter weihaiensis]|uniref:ATP-binding protein n=1 Tax=Roseobacter weihaiensis TaxID=2763262 RepID=UPI001D0B723F|nr:adenylate/guanylate cyclase domain-containing protein [Roseobacter sp. H9]